MKDKIQKVIKDEIFKHFKVTVDPVITRPYEKFGDYTTNVSFGLAHQLNKNPKDIAETLIEGIRHSLASDADHVTNVSNFINIKLSDGALLKDSEISLEYKPSLYSDQVIVCEYSDPNPFKVLHVGHLYTSIVGNAIANLFEVAGGKVFRVNFGGDVGRHVAINMWAILNNAGRGDPKVALESLASLEAKTLDEKASWLADRYVEGTQAFESEDSEPHTQIMSLNKQLYEIVNSKDHDSDIAKIYWLCRDWSYAYFKKFYQDIEIKAFDRYYPESETAPIGISTVNKQLKNGVYENSDGAVVFKGEKYGLHTRVFITSQGLPSYETKDLGLIMAKYRDFKFDKSIVITGNEITEYMRVVLKSLEQYEPRLVKATTHLTHGMVKMAGGVKISSRKGNGLRAKQVIEDTARINFDTTNTKNMDTTLGAIKYAFLKQRLGPDLIYNPEESVSITGNSGPYLQYSHARSRSILKKATGKVIPSEYSLDEQERQLARKISEFPDYLDKAIVEIMPHHLCTYLYELSQSFNKFYEVSRVIDDEREAIRLKLVSLYSDILKKGLELLSISAPNQL